MTAAGLACVACGTELPPNSKFCNECGSPVAVRRAHRRSTSRCRCCSPTWCARWTSPRPLDAERLREIMTELVDRSAPVVHRYGGTVEVHRRRGHGGLRRPRGIGGSRFSRLSCRPGYSGGDRPVGGRRAARDGVELQLRVGLNSGRVIAGEIGSGPFGYTAIGEPVGMAQRMESVAPAGWGDAVGIHRAAGRARRDAGRSRSGCASRAADVPVRARRLLAMAARDGLVGRAEASWSGGAGRWRRSTPWWIAPSVAAGVW